MCLNVSVIGLVCVCIYVEVCLGMCLCVWPVFSKMRLAGQTRGVSLSSIVNTAGNSATAMREAQWLISMS